MRLFLAFAVLMLALVAFTEAQEETFHDKMSRIGARLSEIGSDLGSRAQTFIDDVSQSQQVVKAKDWLAERLEELRQKFS